MHLKQLNLQSQHLGAKVGAASPQDQTTKTSWVICNFCHNTDRSPLSG